MQNCFNDHLLYLISETNTVWTDLCRRMWVLMSQDAVNGCRECWKRKTTNGSVPGGEQREATGGFTDQVLCSQLHPLSWLLLGPHSSPALVHKFALCMIIISWIYKMLFKTLRFCYITQRKHTDRSPEQLQEQLVSGVEHQVKQRSIEEWFELSNGFSRSDFCEGSLETQKALTSHLDS